MRWQGGRRSENVEDQRGRSPVRMAGGGGIGLLVLALIVWLMGGNPMGLLQQAARQQRAAGPAGSNFDPNDPRQKELADFVSVVLGDTEDVWREVFARSGERYQDPTLVLFNNSVDSACGSASSAMGPFYCPGDAKVYLDLSFFDELDRKFDAAGDFAQAYVIAHEVGHHVQNLMGISDKVHRAQQSVNKEEGNELSVRLELQADFFAGVWAHHAQKARNILEKGDIEEALNCAAQIGDDMIQKRAQGYVVPESFTHGTAEQRAKWFKRGLQTGDMKQGDTFNARDL